MSQRELGLLDRALSRPLSLSEFLALDLAAVEAVYRARDASYRGAVFVDEFRGGEPSSVRVGASSPVEESQSPHPLSNGGHSATPSLSAPLHSSFHHSARFQNGSRGHAPPVQPSLNHSALSRHHRKHTRSRNLSLGLLARHLVKFIKERTARFFWGGE